MAEDIKGLIEKIQQEGIKAAEDKAREIEHQATQRAKTIIKEAEKQAKRLIDNAKDEIAKMGKSADASLRQAGRDLLLSLREEINLMLKRVIVSQVRAALSPAEMSKIITGLIKKMGAAGEGEVIVSLNEKDLKKVERSILHNLGAGARKAVALKPSGEITGGFIISYDGAKSHFDFTDKAIAEYLGLHLRPKLAELLKAPAKGAKKRKRN